MNPRLEVARRAAAEAVRLQREGLTTARQVAHKGRYDLVTDVDRRCQDAILRLLAEAEPGVAVVAEESAAPGAAPPAAEHWLVDPLDGTTNYAHGFPAFSTCLALRRAGLTELGLVWDPVRDERFEAARGEGAWLNGCPVRVSATCALEDALLATGFPYDRARHPDPNLRRFAALTMRTRGVRRSGSASLDLCYTACGRLDGYWELRIEAWDVCAGALLVEEAGGRVTAVEGGPFDGSGRSTLATNGRLHDELGRALAAAGPG